MKPSPIALVVCDNVYKEPGGKTALVGLFNRITATVLPMVHAKMGVYAAVTEMRPGCTLRVAIVHGESSEAVVTLDAPVPEQVEPTAICDIVLSLGNLTFKEAGRHYVQFWANDHLLLQRPFDVSVPEREGERDDE